jgi:hypothetical protein
VDPDLDRQSVGGVTMMPETLMGGDHWRLSTTHGIVHVWRPRGYQGTQSLVYVHGYYTPVDEAWSAHQLAKQFSAAGVNAVFVVPEAPIGNDDSVKWTSLTMLLAEVTRQTGLAFTAPYNVIGHSGAFRTIAMWLSTPGLQRITLLDALYGNVQDFVKWAGGGQGRKLVTLALEGGGTPDNNSRAIANKPGVQYVPAASSHMGLVTSGAFLPQFIRSMTGVASGSALVFVLALGAAYLLLR